MRCLFTLPKRIPYNYHKKSLIQNPITLGEKLRNRRIELGLLQSEVAVIFKTSPESIYLWEKDRVRPSITQYPKVIEYLGYFPFEIDTNMFSGQLKRYRYEHGLSQEKMAEYLDIDESTVFYYERRKYQPSLKIIKKLELCLKN